MPRCGQCAQENPDGFRFLRPAHVLRARGDETEAAAVLDAAIAIYERKGEHAAAARARANYASVRRRRL